MTTPALPATTEPDPRRHARLRVVTMVAIGLATGVVMGALDSWVLAPAVGWAAAAIVYDVWVWRVIRTMDAEATRAHAAADDPGRATRDVLIQGGNVASLVAVAILVIQSLSATEPARGVDVAVAPVTIVASWVLLHTLYTLRYAALYFDADPPGGITFNQDDEPDFLDFAYLSFTIGMAYAVSDESVTARQIRRTVFAHSLQSFVFGTGVIAATLSLLVGLAQ